MSTTAYDIVRDIALDWYCRKYGKQRELLTEDEITNAILEHKESVKVTVNYVLPCNPK